jgi:putative transposase
MEKRTTRDQDPSRVTWDHLEAWVRREEDVTELLGRSRSERREQVDSPPGYRNGYGKERNLTLSCGTITLRRPRVRGLDGSVG